MAIAPDDSDNRLRARASSSPASTTTAPAATYNPLSAMNAAPATSAPSYNPLSGITTPAPTTVTSNRSGVTAATGTRLAATLAAQNQANAELAAKKAAGPTSPAPAGYYYKWVGSEYKLYKSPTSQTAPSDGGSGDTGKTPERPVGVPPAFIYDPKSKTWIMPPKPTGEGNWTWDNNEGWVNTTVQPGSTGFAAGSDRTLAIDTFKNTLALFFGPQEVTQPWVDALYKVVSNYYNSGSTIDEANNLALQEVRNNPVLAPFTKRFSGIYALQDRLAKGEAISVPTIAEYFKSESTMGDVLRQAGMGELATQDFLGNVLGLGKSVLEVTNLINDTFYSIDNAPAALKKDLQEIMNLGVSRTDIAKALLTGAEGAKELNKKISGITTLSAAKSQGVTIGMETAADIAARGFGYNESLTGFGNVKRLERGQALAQFGGENFTQQEAIASTFENSVAAQEKIARIGEQEVGRFSARTGRLASQSRAQGQI